MFFKKIIALSLALSHILMVSLPSPVFAGEFSVFQKTYVRDTNVPDTIEDMFAVLNTNTDWTLRAVNGNLEDDEVDKVSSSTMILNGGEVLQPKQFNQNVNVVESSVLLNANNTMQTTLKSKPGGQLTVSIKGTDNNPPVAQWMAPQANAIFDTTSVFAQVSLSDDIAGLNPQSLQIFLDNQLITAQFSPFNQPTLASILQANLNVGEGPHTLSVQANDLAGNATSVSVLFTVQLFSLDPVGNQIINVGSTLSLNLTATGGNGPLTFSASPLPLPDNSHLNAVTGAFTFAPGIDQVGDIDITFIVSDGESTDSEDIIITVPPISGITTFRGFIHTENSQPLANVRLVLGTTDLIETFSQSDGSYFFNNVSVSGQQRLLIDGSTVDPALGVFATVPEMITLIEGADNVLEPAIVLLPLDIESADSIDPFTTSVVTSSPIVIDGVTHGPVTLTVFSESATLEGTEDLYDGIVYISNIPDPTQGPQPLPDDMVLSVYIAIQPFGVKYDPPALISFPNVENFPPKSIVDIFGLNHETGEFEKVGEGSVSTNGATVNSIGGVVHNNSWHGFVVQPPTNNSQSRDTNGINKKIQIATTCKGGSEFCVQSGDLSEDHQLVSTRSQGQSRAHRLVYHSTSADPRPIVSIESTLGIGTPPPETVSMSLKVGGIDQGNELFALPNLTQDRFGNFLPTRPAAQFNAATYPTGRYPFEATLNCNFPISRRSFTQKGSVFVQNEINSPFGAGWTLDGLARLNFQDDGDVVISEGDGSILAFAESDIDFANPAFFPLVGVNFHDLEAGDFNNDGNPDIVLTNSENDTVSIMLADGTGSFSSPVDVPVGNGPISLVIEDFNEDGNFDLAVTNVLDDNVAVLLGDGTGNFSDPMNFPVGDRPRPIVVGDFNGDTHLDLAVGNTGQFDNDISILLGDGTGAFSGPTDFEVEEVSLTGSNALDIAVDDFNGDFFLDLAVADFRAQNIAILLGDGAGAFLEPTTFPIGNLVLHNIPIAVKVGDFNNDTFSDLVVTNAFETTNIAILFGDGTGSFSEPIDQFLGHPSNSVDVADLNFDGNLDLVIPNSREASFSVLLGNGNGGFSNPLRFEMGLSGGLVIVRDFNNDDTLDVATFIHLTKSVSVVSGIPNDLDKTFFNSPPGDFSELVENPDGSFTRTMKDGIKVNFDADGLQTAVVDRNGNTTSYDYDARGRLIQTTDPVGLMSIFSYSGDHLESVVDPTGRTTRFFHDTAGNLTDIIDPDGSIRIFEYDGSHKLISQKSKRNFNTAYTYDFAGRIKQADRADGSITKLSPGAVVGLIDTSTGAGTEANPAPPVALFRDAVATYTDGNNNTTQFITDQFGGSVSIVEALGKTTFINRDSNSNPTTIKTPIGGITRMTYDGRGNLFTFSENQRFGVSTTAFTYEETFNQVTSIKDPKGNTTTINYDANGNPVEIIDNAGTVTKMEYTDAHCPGQLTSTTAAVGLPEETTTQFEYNPGTCNLVKTIDPLLNETVLTYDTSGNVRTSTDAEGKFTEFFYDTMNRLIQVRDADLKNTFYTYDAVGNLTKVTDGNNGMTQFEYDEADRLVKTIDPLGKVETFSYDANGNLIQTIDRRLQTIDFAYDALNRLITKTLPGALVTNFTYDRVGNLLTANDPDSALTFTYDGASQLTSASTTGSPNQPAVTIDYTYDKNGNRDTMNTGLLGKTIYGYDSLNRVSSVNPPQLGSIMFNYDALSRRTIRNNILVGPNITTFYIYDAASQLTSLTHTLGAATLSSFGYTYDNVGNRTTQSTVRGTVSVNNPLSYTYDNLYRLTQATNPLLALPDETFDYDSLGNRNPLSQTYDAANRLLDDGMFTYSYDDNGNLVQKTETATSQTTAYTYDAENQLIRIDFPDATFAEYKYDGLGRRIEKNVNGTITRYVYDNEDILFEYDGANNLLARYTHGPGIDEPLAMQRDLDLSGFFGVTEAFHYHTDGLGSIVDLTDNLGAVVQSYVYDSFGNIVAQNGSLLNPYTYTGREFDEESGLYYYRARYYDSSIGRFLQEDSLGLLSGLNLYNYAINNPINLIDPSGLQSVIEYGTVVTIIAIGIGSAITVINRNGNPPPIFVPGNRRPKVIIRTGQDPFNPFTQGPGDPNFFNKLPFAIGGLAWLGNQAMNFFNQTNNDPALQNPVTNQIMNLIENPQELPAVCGSPQTVSPFANRT